MDITSIRGISGSRRYLEGNAELNLPLSSPTSSRVPFPLCSVPSSMEPTTALSTPEVLLSFLTSLFSPSLVVLPILEPLSSLHFPCAPTSLYSLCLQVFTITLLLDNSRARPGYCYSSHFTLPNSSPYTKMLFCR